MNVTCNFTKAMNKFILLSFIIFLNSCNKTNYSKDECDITYGVLINDNNKYISYLEQNIQNNIKEKKEDLLVNKYDLLTKTYLEYLGNIKLELKRKNSNILFDGDGYSDNGTEFLSKTNNYRKSIINIVKDENLKLRINLILNTNDVKQPNGGDQIAENNVTNEKETNKVYFRYLDYYYRNLSNNQVLAFISNKEKSILEFENEFIKSNG